MPRKADTRTIKELILEIQEITDHWMPKNDYRATEVIALKHQVDMVRSDLVRLNKLFQTELEKIVIQRENSQNIEERFVDIERLILGVDEDGNY